MGGYMFFSKFGFICLFLPEDVDGILSIEGSNEAVVTRNKSSLLRSSTIGTRLKYRYCAKNYKQTQKKN